eukprot:6428256-Lingulodinium_polyedra.AAC.1
MVRPPDRRPKSTPQLALQCVSWPCPGAQQPHMQDCKETNNHPVLCLQPGSVQHHAITHNQTWPFVSHTHPNMTCNFLRFLATS